MASPISIKSAYLLAGVVLFTYFAIGAFATDQITIKEEKVYFGNPKNYTSPAQLELAKVLDATREYQRIKKEKMKSDNPLYWILLQRANEKVYTAIKKVAEEKKYDLVGELGYITGTTDPIPDITKSVIDALDQK
ncbi:MAG: OmpH family outer membrane protein [bacterium]|nr:OmpH family outer membrane protein [bacterium]